MMNPALEVPQVEGSVFSSTFTEEVEPRVWDDATGQWKEETFWWSGLRYRCPVCQKPHRTKVGGRGELPKEFKTRCKSTDSPVIVVPWRVKEKQNG